MPSKFAKPRRKKAPVYVLTYSLVDEILASATAPLPEKARLHQLTVMWQGLASLEGGDNPSTNDWRVCSDAVNLMETFVTMGIVEDASGLLMDAVTALAMAGRRHQAGKPLRLDGPGIQAVRSILEDYAGLLDQLSHRTVVRCHRLTEARIRAIMDNRKKPHDVEILAI